MFALDELELPATARLELAEVVDVVVEAAVVAVVAVVVAVVAVVAVVVGVVGVATVVVAAEVVVVAPDEAPTPLAMAIAPPTAAKPAMLAAPTARRALRAGCGRRRR